MCNILFTGTKNKGRFKRVIIHVASGGGITAKDGNKHELHVPNDYLSGPSLALHVVFNSDVCLLSSSITSSV